jgi:hypothetical protein
MCGFWSNEVQAVAARHSRHAKASEEAMEEGVGGGKCLRALALPEYVDDLAGRCPAERTWDHGAASPHRYELKPKLWISPLRLCVHEVTALQMDLAFRTCSGPTGY